MASGTDPADVLKLLFCDGCPSVIGREPNFTRVKDGLIGKGVIKPAEATNITAQHNLNDDQRGSKLVELLDAKMTLENSDHLKYANAICAVFESKEVNNDFLKEKAAKIRSKLKSINTQKDTSKVAGVEDSDLSKKANSEGIDSPDGPTTTDPAPVPPAKHFSELKDIKPEYKSFSRDLVQDITVLLMTATPIELQGIMGYLEPKDGIIETFTDAEAGKIKFYIGKYGQYPVAVGMTAPAKAHQGPIDATNVTTKIMNAVKPRYVIAVGICYGMNRSKTSSGDVIVSDHIVDATCLRYGDTPQLREGIHSAGATLLSVFGTNLGYSHTQDDIEVKVHCGDFIARPDLVDNREYKEQLKKLRLDALGGEMEGAGIMAAIKNATYVGVEAIIIKAICDWGDGKKSKDADWKPFSSHAAARYVHHQMDKYPDVLNKKTK